MACCVYVALHREYQWRRQWHPTPVLLPGKSHGRRSLVGCSPWGCYESDTTERLHFHFSLSYIAEGNGYPLQCSCLENPRDGGAWRAAVYGVPQSRTRLKRLSSSSSSLYSDLDFPNKPSWSSFLSLDWRYCGDCLLSGDGGSVFFLSLPQPSTPSSPPQTLTSAPWRTVGADCPELSFVNLKPSAQGISPFPQSLQLLPIFCESEKLPASFSAIWDVPLSIY